MKAAKSSPLNYHFLAGDQVQVGNLPPGLTAGLETLPFDHAAYFDLSMPHQVIPLDELVASRARHKGVANANMFMRQAAAGEIPRRPPISTERIGGRMVLVLDGNSTFINALWSGWSDIPCTMVDGPVEKK